MGMDDSLQGMLMGKWEVRRGHVRAGKSDQCEPWGQHWDNSRWPRERCYWAAVTRVPAGVPADAQPSRRVVGLQMTAPETLTSSLCFRLDMQHEE